jgi:hypothetical protein
VLLYWQGRYSQSLGAAGDATIAVQAGAAEVKSFGKTEAGANFGFPGADRKYGNKFTLAENGFVTKITARMAGSGDSSGSQRFRAMVYAADGTGGASGTLLAASAEIVVAGDAAEGNVDFPISPKVFLPAGEYWLMQHSGPESAKAGISQIKPHPTTLNNYNVDSFADGPSNPAGPVSVQGAEYTLSASYEVAGTPVTGRSSAARRRSSPAARTT